jgi:hypothetical protein
MNQQPLVRSLIVNQFKHLAHEDCRVPEGYKLLRFGEDITPECKFTSHKSPGWIDCNRDRVVEKYDPTLQCLVYAKPESGLAKLVVYEEPINSPEYWSHRIYDECYSPVMGKASVHPAFIEMIQEAAVEPYQQEIEQLKAKLEDLEQELIVERIERRE